MGQGRFALIEGKEKALLVDEDAVHYIFDKNKIALEIGLVRLITGGIPIVLEMTVTLNNEMLGNMVFEEKELGVFVRHFSERIERNYDKLLESIKEIGFDSDDYPRREIEAEPVSKRRLRNI